MTAQLRSHARLARLPSGRSAAFDLLPLCLCLLLGLLITAPLEARAADVVFVTPTTYSLAANFSVIQSACQSVHSNSSAFTTGVITGFGGLDAAMAAAGVSYAYVSAIFSTENQVWQWVANGVVSNFAGIVTAGQWLTGYPTTDTALTFAAYNVADAAAADGAKGLINVDGTATYPVACMYNYVPSPPPEAKKSAIPWWGILILVLGLVAILAAVIAFVVLPCFCNKKSKDSEATAAQDDEAETRRGDNNNNSSSNNDSGRGDSDGESEKSDASSTNRSFTSESASAVSEAGVAGRRA